MFPPILHPGTLSVRLFSLGCSLEFQGKTIQTTVSSVRTFLAADYRDLRFMNYQGSLFLLVSVLISSRAEEFVLFILVFNWLVFTWCPWLLYLAPVPHCHLSAPAPFPTVTKPTVHSPVLLLFSSNFWLCGSSCLWVFILLIHFCLSLSFLLITWSSCFFFLSL